MKAFLRQSFTVGLFLLILLKLQAKEIFKPLSSAVKTPISLKYLEFVPLEVQYYGFMSLKDDNLCYVFCFGDKDWVYLKKNQRSYAGFTLKQVDLDHKSVFIEKDDGELYRLFLGQKTYMPHRFKGRFYDKKSQKMYDFSEKNLSFWIDKRKVVLKQDPEDLKQFYVFEMENEENFCAYCLNLEDKNKKL